MNEAASNRSVAAMCNDQFGLRHDFVVRRAIDQNHCHTFEFGYCCTMVRLGSTVLLSAIVSSILGTLLLVAWEGGTGSINPAGFFVGFAATTMMFTVPGAILLMAMTFVLADRRLSQPQAAVVLLLAGTLAGAAMLALLSMVIWGAIFGCLTAATFVSILTLFEAILNLAPNVCFGSKAAVSR